MTKKWNLIVDVELCVNCHNCVLATKDEHIGNDFPGYSAAQPLPGLDTIRIDKHTRGSGTQVETTYIPKMCNHCDDAPCMSKDTGGAIRKRNDGIVIIDPALAHSRDDIPSLCPYGMIKWDSEAKIPHIWNFDAHLLDGGWKEPRCTHACPTGAIKAVKCTDAEMAATLRDQKLTTSASLAGARPRTHYANAYRFNTNLVAGTIVKQQAGMTACASDVHITLLQDGKEIASTASDAFGEFCFDRVAPDAQDLKLRLTEPGGNHRFVAIEAGRTQMIEIAL